MVIVDAQVHVWGPETPQRPWAPGGANQAHRPVPLGNDELLRVFWGTDLTRLSCPYRRAVTLCTKELDSLAEEDKQWITGRGIAEWLGWPLPCDRQKCIPHLR